jgi:hypothetical protein
MTQPNGSLPGGQQPGAPFSPGAPIAPVNSPHAAPSQLTGRKLLFIVLGLVAGLIVLIVGTLGIAAFFGWKIFQAAH